MLLQPIDQLIRAHAEIMACVMAMEPLPADPRALRAAAFVRLQRAFSEHNAAEQQVLSLFSESDTGEAADAGAEAGTNEPSQALLQAVEEAMRDRSDWTEPLQKLREYMQAHIDEEEQVVLPMVQMILSEDQQSGERASAPLDSDPGDRIFSIRR